MKVRLALRALMKSALPLLNNALASRAVSSFRVWGSRSDLSCHQLDHPSHRAGRFLTLLGSTPRLLVSSLLPDKLLDTQFYLLLLSPLSTTSWRLLAAFAHVCTIDATPTQQGPHDPRILVRHRYRCPVPPSTHEQPPYPLAAPVRLQLHPAKRRPCPVDQQLTQVAIAPLADP